MSSPTRKMSRDRVADEARILIAAIAERSGYPEGMILVGWNEVHRKDRVRKIEEMRQWVADFDSGEIIPDKVVGS